MMTENNFWCHETDELLKYLYQDLQIFNWSLISKEVSQRSRFQTNPDECRNRYVQIYGPVERGQWTPQQQKELYRLHNQNGNKWAIIALNLLGRNDNCVKNHFYSKLRKSLRTINKIAKLHLKKQAKQISDVVIYKLTEATDESLKENSEVSKQIITMCYDLKNRLLEYQMDQKDIKDNLDYRFEKQLLHGLAQFNKIYKKKSKKEKVSMLGAENLKKKRNSKKNTCLQDFNVQYEDGSYLASQDDQEQQQAMQKTQSKIVNKKATAKNQINKQQNMQYFPPPPRSQSQYSTHKKTINFLIKAPSLEQKSNYEKKNQNLSGSPKNKQKEEQSQTILQFPALPVSNTQNKNKSRIEDILKAEGILQNGLSGTQNYFRRQNSMRSFSICSESSNLDMFGQDLAFGPQFKDLSSMENDSHIFRTNQSE